MYLSIQISTYTFTRKTCFFKKIQETMKMGRSPCLLDETVVCFSPAPMTEAYMPAEKPIIPIHSGLTMWTFSIFGSLPK